MSGIELSPFLYAIPVCIAFFSQYDRHSTTGKPIRRHRYHGNNRRGRSAGHRRGPQHQHYGQNHFFQQQQQQQDQEQPQREQEEPQVHSFALPLMTTRSHRGGRMSPTWSSSSDIDDESQTVEEHEENDYSFSVEVSLHDHHLLANA